MGWERRLGAFISRGATVSDDQRKAACRVLSYSFEGRIPAPKITGDGGRDFEQDRASTRPMDRQMGLFVFADVVVRNPAFR